MQHTRICRDVNALPGSRHVSQDAHHEFTSSAWESHRVTGHMILRPWWKADASAEVCGDDLIRWHMNDRIIARLG